MFIGLRCTSCEAKFDNREPYTLCAECGGLLDPYYDYEAIKTVVNDMLGRRERSIWRWRELLPINTLMTRVVTLGEGGTPLLRSERLAEFCGVEELYLKNDTANPTGSLKDRSVPIAASKALEFGCDTLTCDSTGNKGAAVAAYAARAGLKSIVFCPESTPKEKLGQAILYGAHVVRVKGDYTAVNGLYKELMGQGTRGWYDCGTSNPYRYEGKKTYAYEIAEMLDWRVPDRIVHPANGGMSIVKTYKGFRELNMLGLVNGMPRMTVVQPRDYASIASAVRTDGTIKPVPGGRTIASALAARDPGDLGRLAATIIRSSGGTGVAIDDDDIRLSVSKLAAEGILTEPSGAVTVVGLRNLVREGLVKRSERVVCVLTGSGFKDFGSILDEMELPNPVELSLDAVKSAVLHCGKLGGEGK